MEKQDDKLLLLTVSLCYFYQLLLVASTSCNCDIAATALVVWSPALLSHHLQQLFSADCCTVCPKCDGPYRADVKSNRTLSWPHINTHTHQAQTQWLSECTTQELACAGIGDLHCLLLKFYSSVKKNSAQMHIHVLSKHKNQMKATDGKFTFCKTSTLYFARKKA